MPHINLKEVLIFISRESIRRFIKIVEDHVQIKSIKLRSFSSKEFKHITIPIDVNKINDILGTKLNEIEYLNYLDKLGFKINNKITVPPYRMISRHIMI